MTVLLILLILFIIILIIQLDLQGKISYNFISNTGTFTLKLFGILVLKYVFSLKKGYIEVCSKKKQHLYPIEFNKESIDKVNKIQAFVFSKVYFKKINIYINLGFKNNAFETAILTGGVNVLLSNILVWLKNAKNEVVERICIYNDYDKNLLDFTFKFSISISIFDLIWCFVENLVYKQIYKNTITKNEQTK